MSQDLQHYDTIRLDKNRDEAGEVSVTATVGPTESDMDATRGVQITLSTPNGWSYARLSEPQVRALISVLQMRVNPDKDHEATGWSVDPAKVLPDGTNLTNKEINQE